MRIVLALFVVAACSTPDSVGPCQAPKTQQFSCSPVAAGSAGCIGGCVMACGINDKTVGQFADETFPIGCTATLTVCTTYPEPLTCTCVANPNGSAGWAPGGC